jgi:anti-repressor protein
VNRYPEPCEIKVTLKKGEIEMENLQVFSYEGNEIRTVRKIGEPWWVAKDVCKIFGESHYRRAMQALGDDEKGVTQINTPGGKQYMTIINEVGLYSLLFAMQPTKARGVSEEYIIERENQLNKFKRWVTHEVLPSIRKHGAYVTPARAEELMNDPDAWIGLLTALKEERAAKAQLQIQAVADKPKVIFADAVSVADSTILIGELAKILKGNGVEIGQNRLFEKLRQDGYLIRRQGSDYNMPTQKSMELELFKIKETAITHSDGHVTVNKTPKVTGKGQQYFVNLFLSA